MENLSKKISKHGFMLACDTIYFNNWAKVLFYSLKENSPWAHVHFHLFDPTTDDINWVSNRECSYTFEMTPEKYVSSIDLKKMYWVTARYTRFAEIYDDSTMAINLDADSIAVTPLSYEIFETDLKSSWVPTALKREQLSLCSAFGFGLDNTRHILRKKYLEVMDTPNWFWTFDQRLVDKMLELNEVSAMDLRYTDFKFKDTSYIWTGKGDRVYKERFKEASEKYQKFI